MKLYVLLFAACAPALGANLLLNPGFEQNALTSPFVTLASGDATALPNWTVTGACGTNCLLVLRDDYQENSNVGVLQFLPQSGRQSLDITGGGNTISGGVQQSVSLTPGVAYSLSFWLANMDNRASSYTLSSAVQVFLNGASQGTFTNSSTTNNFNTWNQYTLTFTPTVASNTILFQNATGAADSLAGLDDVFLDVAAPEPGTGVLLGLGVAAGIALRRLTQARRQPRRLQ